MYVPVLKYSSLLLLCSNAVSEKRILRQGDCKMHFAMPVFQMTNSPLSARQLVIQNTTMILTGSSTKLCTHVHGCPQRHGTWDSPRHSTIPVSSLAPSASASASGKPLTSTQPPSPDVPSAPATPHSSDSPALIHVGIYVDDFVFYSTDPAQETLFMEALKQGAVIDFMGPVYWFFGTAFTWKRHDDGWPSLRSSLSIRLY